MADCVPGKISYTRTQSNLGNQSQICCEPCEEDGEHKEGAGFCVDCQEYLCDHCYKNHCVPRRMRHHFLLDKKAMPKRKVESDFADLCHIHDGALNKYYCKAHEVTGCIACMNSDHKSCGEFSILADITKNFEDSELVKDFCAWANQAEQEIDDHNDLTEDNIQISKHSAEKAISEINIYQKKINEKFDQLKKNIIKEAINTEQQDVQKIIKLQQLVRSAGEDLAQVKSDIVILQSTKQSKQLFLAMKSARLQRYKLENQLKELRENNNVRKYEFVENELLKNMLSNIDQIGELLIHNDSGKKPVSSFANNYQKHGKNRTPGVPEKTVLRPYQPHLGLENSAKKQ